MPWIIGVPSALLIAVLLTVAILYWRYRRNRIKNYSCAEAQLVSKKAQKHFHKELRKLSDKLLYHVLKIVDASARNRRNDVYVDTSPFDTRFSDPADAKKNRNAVKESLRSRGFSIIPDEKHREAVIHISWQTNRTI
jgi:hypothetical protein